MVKTLLPSHKTAVQKALDCVSGERFESLDLGVISILPLTCPAEILPHLALSFDVDTTGLDETQTRELLQDAFQIHHYAGTPYSINKALGVVFKDAGVEEWFEYGGDPYYFRITVNSNPNITGIDKTLLEKLVKTANRYKNARSLLDYLRLSVESAGKVYVGAAINSGVKSVIYPANSADLTLRGDIFTAAATQTVQSMTITYGE